MMITILAGLLAVSDLGKWEYSIKNAQGQSKAVLVFAPKKSDERFQKQIEVFRTKFKELRDRGTKVFYILEHEDGRADNLILRREDAASVRKAYKISSGDFRMILVGRDGKIAWIKKEPVVEAELWKLIHK